MLKNTSLLTLIIMSFSRLRCRRRRRRRQEEEKEDRR